MGRGENGSGNVVENALIKIPLEVLSRCPASPYGAWAYRCAIIVQFQL